MPPTRGNCRTLYSISRCLAIATGDLLCAKNADTSNRLWSMLFSRLSTEVVIPFGFMPPRYTRIDVRPSGRPFLIR